MIKKYAGAIHGICILLLIGIVGNVECGASLKQLLWFIPITGVMIAVEFSELFINVKGGNNK